DGRLNLEERLFLDVARERGMHGQVPRDRGRACRDEETETDDGADANGVAAARSRLLGLGLLVDPELRLGLGDVDLEMFDVCEALEGRFAERGDLGLGVELAAVEAIDDLISRDGT